MADEKIKDEILKDEELDNVAGGNRIETYEDGNELYKRGLLTLEQAMSSTPVREKLHELGYTGYKDIGGLDDGNIYTDKQGKTVTREEFWKIFDIDNPAKATK